jgi:uncharacterized short protein YbdD (DUF466 family)
MKKPLSIFGVVLLLGIILFFYQQNRKDNLEKPYTDLEGNNSPVVVFKNEKSALPSSVMPELNQKIIKTEDKNFAEYDQNEKEWLTRIENILGENDYQYYVGLRNKNEEEKMKAYKEFHDYLRQKNGDNFSYNISEDQSIREKEINTKYTREFLKHIGEEKFKSYLKVRDEFNAELQRKSKNGSALVVEF